MGGDSSNNLVANNKVELNKKYGVYINEVSYELPHNRTNQFQNNIFNNTVNLFNDTSIHYTTEAINNGAGIITVAWNTTKTSGTNILGGPYLGGNFWAKPDGTGFSQICNDWNRDGIGDSIYTISAYDVDYFSLVSISKQDQPIFPVADFNVNVTGGYVPLSVLFSDFSQNATSRIWDFDNDGVADSTDKTPVYVYAVAGTYTVNLTVNNANGTVSRLYPIMVSNRPQYTLKETQITSNKSGQASPAIYGDRIVWTDWCNEYRVDGLPDTKNADIYICTVSGVKPLLKTPVADFFTNLTSGNAPLKVLFTNNSTGAPNFWYWDFGDDINSKHALNATHTFSEPGKYDVSLTVTNENGSNTWSMPGYITVSKSK